MQNEQMVGILNIFSRDLFEQSLFYGEGGFARSNANPIPYPENVGIDGDGGLSKLGIEYHIGGFSPHAGECFQSVTIWGYFSMMLSNELLGQAMNMTGLGIEKSEATNMIFNALFTERSHAEGIGRLCEQSRRTQIDHLVGTLGGKNYGYQQLKGAGVLQFGFGFGDAGAERGKALLDVFGIHSANLKIGS